MDSRNRYRSNYTSYYQPQQRTVQPQPVSRPRRLPKVLVFSGITLLLLVSYVWANAKLKDVHAENKEVLAKVNQPVPIDEAALAAQVNAVIGQYPKLDISVATIDLANGNLYHYGVKAPFIAASTAKLLTASLYLQHVEEGKASLTDRIGGKPARYQLQKLIIDSDNNAWQAFNDLLGHDALKVYADGLGLSDYDPDKNTLTADDIALLLQKLYKRQLLNDSHTNLLLSFMNNASESQFIASAVPEGTKVYHKAGYLDDRAHDAAIIDNGKHAFVLVIFTKAPNTYDFQSGANLFHQITAAAVKVYQ